MAPKIRRSHDDYTVAWICAIPVEAAAAEAMLDEIHEPLPVQSNDHNAYSLGRIGEHDVVIACLPSSKYGTVSASSVVVQLLSTFRSVRFGLMVGIGGAVPGSADIRLGDIVVSKPTNGHGGVIEYDFGKVLKGEQFQATGMFSRPPQILLTALSKLQANHINHGAKFMEFCAGLEGKSVFTRPAIEDRLYRSDYDHPDSKSPTCIDCDASRAVSRPPRKHRGPAVHYGLIASANQVVKNSNLRDELGWKLGAYCIEMEAAGIMDNLPSIVVRGICYYADSHKNDQWQGYASAVAAAYAKELLLHTSVARLERKYHVSFDVNALSAAANFIGRDDELEQLWQYLRPSSQRSQKVAVVHGLGGMGKTQLAMRFARAHKNDFSAVLWLNGKSRETLLQSLSSALSKLPGQDSNITARNEDEVRGNASQVLEWLALSDNTSWLFIFDNVDQYSPGTDGGYDVGKFFPAADHGSSLITSRLLKLSELGKSFPLQKLDQTYATQLLLQSTGISSQEADHAKDINRDVADLVEHLDGLPLAITLAGSFIRETGTSLDRYLQYYRESWHNLQSQSGSVRQYEQGNIPQTWAVSYEEIKSPDRPEWFDPVMLDELAFKSKMRTLIGFSFVGVKLQHDSYTMHPVVRDWCLSISECLDGAQASRLNGLALVTIVYMIPANDSYESLVLQHRLLPHASYVLGRLQSVLFADKPLFWTSLQCIGDLYAGQCKLVDAEKIYNWVLSDSQKELGPDFESNYYVLCTYHRLGHIYDAQSRLEESQEAYKLAISGITFLQPDHQILPRLMTSLRRVCHRSELLVLAEDMYQRAWLAHVKLYGPDHVAALDSVDALAMIYIQRGLLDMAESTCRTALDGKMKALGPYHIWTLYAMENMAQVYKAQGRMEEAEEMFERSMGLEKILGPEHPAMLSKMYCIAWVYEQREKYEAAEDMWERALRGHERTLGPDHMCTLSVVSGFGDFLVSRKRGAEAEKMYERARDEATKGFWARRMSELSRLCRSWRH
ncbi:hypothetical protein BDW74DRAFT_180259 [Aspergillus multicolor]|uniref:uncharacterized protein n=1 Tax=Aspergillus multicolor TaxID=41759 RepID=UPI003CCCAD9F